MLKTPLWKILEKSAEEIKGKKLSELFAEDSERVNKFSLTVEELYLDFSKNFITEDILNNLIALARHQNVEKAVMKMMTGEAINFTENRPVLHTALRRAENNPLRINGQNIMLKVREQKNKMSQMVHQLNQGEWYGATKKPITDVVNLGIGGSDLGPKMAVQALIYYRQTPLNLHFVSNIDPLAISTLLNHLNPETTLFIVSSKSFTTPETLTNAHFAKNWLTTHLNTKEVGNHFIAVTSALKKAEQFGVVSKNILTFEEWVGGRYSIWSTIGFALAISIGMVNFEAFLEGARIMDEHFLNAPLEKNMPVLLALIGIWYIHGWKAQTLAVLPYAHGLRRLPDYLQQLDMESNGKRVIQQGMVVSNATGPIVWGQAGTNGQHAFYQLLHQGTHFVPIDFIVAAKSETSFQKQHQQFVINCLAQAQALMQGNQLESNKLHPHEVMPGNKPSNILLLSKMSPKGLGQLLALYEHKVFTQGIIWGINSFDQPGVELGKKLASKLVQNLEKQEIDKNIDSSTAALLKKMEA